MSYMRRVGLVVLGLSVVGCGAAVVEASPPCLRVEATGPVSIASPARLTLPFTVESCAGEPQSGLSPDSFVVEEDGRPVSALESSQTITPRGQRHRVHSLLLIDLSGSVLRSGQFPALKEAAQGYLERVFAGGEATHRVALYTFDGRPNLSQVVPFTADGAAVRAGLDALEQPECTRAADCRSFLDRASCAGWRCVDDSTNLNGAVVAALDELEGARGKDPTVSFEETALVLFTDGTDQAARTSAAEVEARARASSARVLAVGLGGEVDAQALGRLGKDGFFAAQDGAELGQAFDRIAGRVMAFANRFYELSYCSPKRSGTHELTLRVRAQTAQGQALGALTQTFDATGFASGCGP